MGSAVLRLEMIRVVWDYFVRLHDISMMLAVGEMHLRTGACEGGPPGEALLFILSEADDDSVYASSAVEARARAHYSASFALLDVQKRGVVSRAELDEAYRSDGCVRDVLGLADQATPAAHKGFPYRARSLPRTFLTAHVPYCILPPCRILPPSHILLRSLILLLPHTAFP